MSSSFDLDLIKEYAYTGGLALALLAIILLVLYSIDHFTQKLKKRLTALKLRSFKIFGLELLNVGKQELIIVSIINGLQVVVSLAFLYLSLVLILSEIPATENIASDLVDLIFEPLGSLLNSFVSYLPNLFNIIVTILIARFLIKAVKYVSSGVTRGSFHFPGFHPRTARTTGGIICFIIYILTIIVIFPSIPGYGSTAFNGIAAFLGALITIGGSSVISNYMAGIVLTYMHAFEKGDWVEIDGVHGKIVVAGAFAVRLESYKKEAINVPNAKVLGSAIRNYSVENKQEIILHTEVSIGYDVAWQKVNDLLIEAAKKTASLKGDKPPFVLQKKLDDFYVVYELIAYLSQPEAKPKAYSDLHANILDVFNEAQIEIMSPHYRAERDGNPPTIPTNPYTSKPDGQS